MCIVSISNLRGKLAIERDEKRKTDQNRCDDTRNMYAVFHVSLYVNIDNRLQKWWTVRSIYLRCWSCN